MQSTRLSFPQVEAPDKSNFINVEQSEGVNIKKHKSNFVASEGNLKSSGKKMSDANVSVTEEEF